MPLQPPKGYLPACIAPLYVIACALQEIFPAEGDSTVSLAALGIHSFSHFSVFHGKRWWSYGLTFGAIEPSRVGVELKLKLREISRPAPRTIRKPPPMRPRIPGQVMTRDMRGSEDETSPPSAGPLRTTTRLAVTLVPPYQDCLAADRLGASAQRLGVIGRARPLQDVRVLVSAIAERLGAEVREALSDGIARAALIEETGDLTAVPLRFWRSEEAELALSADEKVTVPITGGGNARGMIYIDRNALDLLWKTVRSRMFGPDHPAPSPVAKPALSPAMEFMQEVAVELQYSGGIPYGKYSLSKGDIALKIRQLWNEDRLGEYSEALAHAMGTLILHPRARKGGAPDLEERQLRLVYRETVAEKKTKAPSRLRPTKSSKSGRR